MLYGQKNPLGRGNGPSTSLKLPGVADNSRARPFLGGLHGATNIIRDDVSADLEAARAGDRFKEINRLNKLMVRLTRQSLELGVKCASRSI